MRPADSNPLSQYIQSLKPEQFETLLQQSGRTNRSAGQALESKQLVAMGKAILVTTSEGRTNLVYADNLKDVLTRKLGSPVTAEAVQGVFDQVLRAKKPFVNSADLRTAFLNPSPQVAARRPPPPKVPPLPIATESTEEVSPGKSPVASPPPKKQRTLTGSIETPAQMAPAAPGVRNKAPINFKEWGMTHLEYNSIRKFIDAHSEEFAAGGVDMYVDKALNKEVPRSLFYIASGPRKGIYVLLKGKAEGGELGRGVANRATKALRWEDRTICAFRSGRENAASSSEQRANEIADERPDLFFAGHPVSYVSSITPRRSPRGAEKVGQEHNVPKIGYMGDVAAGGALDEYLYRPRASAPTVKAMVAISLQIAKGLEYFHSRGWLHLDVKPANILMDASDLRAEPVAKLADFGISISTEKPTPASTRGSPGFMAPEVAKFGMLSAAADVWALGCTMAQMRYGFAWDKANGQADHYIKHKNLNAPNLISDRAVERAKASCMPDRNKEGSLEWIIDRCLMFDPAQRLTAEQVVEYLMKL